MLATERVNQISRLVEKLTSQEQEALLKGLKRQIILAKAEELDSRGVKAELTMQAIVEEVRKVRQKRYAG